jgi:hypothetical protein
MAPFTQGGAVSWNISSFYAVDLAGIAPAEIIAPGAHFHVNVDFDGSGAVWTALELAGAPYTVKFYAERLGANPSTPAPSVPSERDLGMFSGNLSAAGGPYVASLHVSGGIPIEGVYRFGCLIEISPGSGVVGFDEGLVVSVAAGA